MDKITKIFVISLLSVMFILMFFSSWNESATFNEKNNITAGYSYLSRRDYRLNPENPPLIKDLAAFPLLFLNLKFPTNIPAWTTAINGQWKEGKVFLYESGNDPDKILHFARFPIMLLALFFGWLLFKWARSLYGNKVGFLTLFFYSMSPVIIAHSRYATTDLVASFGFFIGIASFVNFLKNQTRKNLIIAGLILGVVQLLKFSIILLVPIYFILAILWVVFENYGDAKKIIKYSLRMLGKLLLIGVVSVLIVWPVYQFHIMNYPVERQMKDTYALLHSSSFRPAADLTVWLSNKPVFRALGQYFLGISVAAQRVNESNISYFMGTISTSGWYSYLPVVYAAKESSGFLLLALIALIFAVKNIIAAKEKCLRSAIEWAQGNFAITASMVFILVYWSQAIISRLDMGVRYILPTLPFIYFLVSREIIKWSQTFHLEEPHSIFEQIKNFLTKLLKSLEKQSILFALLAWMFISTLIAFPYYLSYYNVITGGTENGYKIAVGSNYDWGQDLKRLKDFVDRNDIKKISLDYFGEGEPSYYLGNKFEPWRSSRGKPKGWFGVSVTLSQRAMAEPEKGFKLRKEDTYSWLKGKRPVARVGTSIFIYKF